MWRWTTDPDAWDPRDDGVPQSVREQESDLIRANAAKRHQERQQEKEALEAYGQLLDDKAKRLEAAKGAAKPVQVAPVAPQAPAKPEVKKLEIGEEAILEKDGDMVKFKRVPSACGDVTLAITRTWKRFASRRTTKIFSRPAAVSLWLQLVAQGYERW